MFDDEDDLKVVEVDLRALVVDGTGSLHDLPTGSVIYLPETMLGLPAGFWRAGSFQSLEGQAARLLEQMSWQEREEHFRAGAPVHRVRVAPGWHEPRPVRVPGLRVGQLRAVLSRAELSDEALVILAPPEHPTGDFSPAHHLATGHYVPHPTGLGTSGEYSDVPSDAVPPGAISALVLRPASDWKDGRT